MEEIKNEALETEAAEAAAEEKAPAKEKKSDSKKQKAEIKKLTEENEALTAKLSEAEDKYLRLAAEYDNFRKRSKAEKDAVYADATQDAVKSLLPLLDNLERAQGFTDAEKVAEGVSMILKSLPDVLAKMNITSFGEAGEEFDPNIHNAVMHVDDDALGEGVIAEVFQRGYMMGEKVIRFAMVKVAN